MSAAVLALGTAAKLFPIVLLPILLGCAWREGRRCAVSVIAIFVGVTAACFLPFFVLAPHGTFDMLTRQFDRPLQLESIAASPLLLAHALFGLSVGVVFSYGSANIGGTSGVAAAALASTVGLIALVAVWIAGRRRDLVLVSATAVAVVLVFGKVLSDQFLLWLFPLIALLTASVGAAAMTVFVAALVITNLIFPSQYLALLQLDRGPIVILALRNVLLVAVCVLLLMALRRSDSFRGDRRT